MIKYIHWFFLVVVVVLHSYAEETDSPYLPFCPRVCHRSLTELLFADFGQIPFPGLINCSQELGVKWNHKGPKHGFLCSVLSARAVDVSRVPSENNLVLFLYCLPSVQLHLPLLPHEILGRPQGLYAHN